MARTDTAIEIELLWGPKDGERFAVPYLADAVIVLLPARWLGEMRRGLYRRAVHTACSPVEYYWEGEVR